ncbi:UDP-N-acetylglucosamine 2-epimerase [uncultured archaeon]|nr:UDP-N-acetylglucosamine 2-epimerase [uncultured archaeon]
MRRKILVTTGTRAEYGILRPLLRAISNSKKLELFLVVTGMHLSKKYGYTIKEIKKDGFMIYDVVDMIPKDDSLYSMSIELGNGVISFSKILRRLKPDINVILGDRDEMLASAIAAYHMNIPNAHIHGGDRTQGGIDEYNRHAITKISNIHFAATKKSKVRIIKMGEDPKYVFLTGSPSIDEIVSEISTIQDIQKKYDLKLSGNEILLVQHPVTTETDLAEKQILSTLQAVIRTKRKIIAIAPNSDAGNRIIFRHLKSYSKKYPSIRLYASLPRSDYLGMIKNCGLLVGNSSSGIIDASYFDTPVVNIGIRQKGRETGSNVYHVEYFKENLIYETILKALKTKRRTSRTHHIYGQGHASEKIVNCLETIRLNRHLIKKQIFY